MDLAISLVFVACMVMGVLHFWRRAEEEARISCRTLFTPWLLKGLVAPLLIWTFFNSGLVIEPLIPRIAKAQAAGEWAAAFFPITAGVAFIIGSYWAAVSLAWVVVELFLRVDRRGEFLGVAAMWLLICAPFGFIATALAGWAGAGCALALLFGAIVHGTASFVPPSVCPSYSSAVAKINFDKFNEAEWEIIRQLEQCEHDFDGWMMLAELYATHFHDLRTAEKTVVDLCDDPSTTPVQFSIALNRLADWHLNVAGDPERAHWALERICERLHGTHMAMMARRRIDGLPRSRDDLAKQRQGKTIRLRVDQQRPLPTTREAAAETANQCVQRLTADPNDVPAREHFAQLLAERLDQPATAIEQLGLLSGMSGQSDEKRASWLLMQADWQRRLLGNRIACEDLLRHIVREFPQTTHAFEAQRRMYLLQVEDGVLRRAPKPGRDATLLSSMEPQAVAIGSILPSEQRR